MKKLQHRDGGIPIGGWSTMRAWEAGALGRWLEQGYDLAAAQAAARLAGALMAEKKVHNLVVTKGLDLVAGLLVGLGEYLTDGLSYHAIGTGDTAPVLGDLYLNTEVARKVFTDRSQSGHTATLSVFYLAAECSYEIEECGIFGTLYGDDISGADSGYLFARYLSSYDNSAGLVDLTFEYSVTVG